MKKIGIIATLLLFYTLAIAQPSTVRFDDERSYFNESQPLPVEKQMLMTGSVNPGIEAVEINFYAAKGREDRRPLYTSMWKKPVYKTKGTFELPINYKLRAGSDYDVQISYYRVITENERKELKKKLYGNLDAFINLSFNSGKNKIKLSKNGRHILNDMNQVVVNGLTYFRNLSSVKFDGFSDIVLEKVKHIEGEKLSKGSNTSSSTDIQETRVTKRDKMIRELKVLVHSELEQLLNTKWGILNDSRYVDDYPTEKTLSILSVNAGYGGVIMTGIDSLSFGGSPYVGLSFPLGKKAMSSPFLSNTSINLGVFINNFKDDSGAELTGPIFKRPYYVGVGYKAFQFIRFNAGATFLESVNTAGLDFTGLGDRVAVRPFIGVSAEIKIWSAFAK